VVQFHIGLSRLNLKLNKRANAYCVIHFDTMTFTTDSVWSTVTNSGMHEVSWSETFHFDFQAKSEKGNN
jgi:hypothetical protein